MKEKYGNILKNPLVRNTMKLSLSNTVMFLLPIIVTPILSRLYSQENYGDWGIFSSAYMIVNALLFFSYENTIVKTKDETEVPVLCRACLVVAFSVIVLTAVVFLGGKALSIGFFTGFPELGLFILLLAISALTQLFYNLCNRYEKYTLMSVTNVIQGAGQAFFRLLFYAVKSVNGLILGNVVAQFMAAASYLVGLRCKTKELLRTKATGAQIKSVLRKYKNFPLYDAPGMILEVSIGNLALIILSLFFSKSDIGCYSIIYQFMILPISLIGSAMAKVYYKDISVAETQEDMGRVTKKVTKLTFVLALLPIAFVMCGGDLFITWYLGEKWAMSGNFALCLSAISVPIILSESLLPIYRVIDKQNIRLKYDILCAIFGLGGMFAACLAHTGIYVALLTYVVLYSIMRYLLFLSIQREAKTEWAPKEMFLGISAVLLCYLILAVRIYILLF